jgi:hypothetical protein
MRKFFQFFSLTILTQGVLLLNQIVLLPIQIRIWGHASTANWYATLALATSTTVADFGLRTAGHAALIRYAHNPGDEQAETEFRHLWAWIKILICVVTFPLIGLDLVYGGYRLWHTALIAGVALETLLCIRVMYLDSLELYREAEAGYLLLAAARLCLTVGALVLFHSSPPTFGWIWFFTGVFAVAHQSRLCRRIGLLRLIEPIPAGLSWRTLAIARHTMADPASTWMRNNVPVLILSAIAQPIAVTTYVALRAVFGAARQMILQLSRYASVQYVSLRQSQTEVAKVHFTLWMLLTAFFTSVLTCIVFADNFRVASFWLVRSDAALYQVMALTFGLASPFYVYQFAQALMLRYGEVSEIARRQYLYIILLTIFAAISLLTKSVVFSLVVILVADVTISFSFMLRSTGTPTSTGVHGSVAALGSALLSGGLWLLVRACPLDFLHRSTTSAIVCTLVLLSLWTLVIAAVYLYIAHDLFPNARTMAGSALRALFNSRSEEPAK